MLFRSGNFIFRVREFEQMELEFFCKPGTDLEWFNYWRTFCHNWLLGIGLKDENLRLRDHDPEELCFYSKATTDFEFLFPFGWGELWGVADRTDYDLTQHQTVSGKDLTYFDPETNERYIPYVVEPSLGVERSVLAVLVDAADIKTEAAALAVGDQVTMDKAATVYGTTRKFSSWVYSAKLYVRAISGDRISVSTLKSGAITGNVDKKYLTKV